MTLATPGVAVLCGLLFAGCTFFPESPVVPVFARDLADQLQCDGAPQLIGGEVGEVRPSQPEGTASLYPWIETLTTEDLPLSGFVESPKVSWEDGRARFVRFEYIAAARVKAVVIMADKGAQGAPSTWRVVAYRACAGDEFNVADGRTSDNAPWHNVTGGPVDVSAIAGPGHCGWQSTTWLRYQGRLYLRDPVGVMDDYTLQPFVADMTAPAGLKDTGLRSRERTLLIGTDSRFVWVRTPASLERWSGVSSEPGCS